MKISNKNKLEWEGKVLPSNNSGEFKILEYKGTNNVLIKFVNTGTELEVSLSNIKKGSVKDPYYPSVYGVGYFGIGEYSSRPTSNGPQCICYKRWKEMIGRCYCKECAEYNSYGARGVTVCDSWLNYQNFARWWEENYLGEEYDLDKDVINKNSKQYNPENCCFLPREINTALTSRRRERGDLPIGVRIKDGAIIAQINYMGSKKHLGTFKTIEEAFQAYKKEKEKCLKEYADKYKNKLPKKVYDALYSYKVDIND